MALYEPSDIQSHGWPRLGERERSPTNHDRTLLDTAGRSIREAPVGEFPRGIIGAHAQAPGRHIEDSAANTRGTFVHRVRSSTSRELLCTDYSSLLSGIPVKNAGCCTRAAQATRALAQGPNRPTLLFGFPPGPLSTVFTQVYIQYRRYRGTEPKCQTHVCALAMATHGCTASQSRLKRDDPRLVPA
jgi:hypothetical protein